MIDRKCPACGATLKPGTWLCEYCNTDWTPPGEPAAGKEVAEKDIEDLFAEEQAAAVPPTPPLGSAVPSVGMPPKTPSTAWHTPAFIILTLFCGPLSLVFLWAVTKWSRKAKVIWTVVILSPVLVFGIYGFFSETKYAVRDESPKIAAKPIPLAQRRTENIDPAQIYRDLRGESGRSLEERKKTWVKQYRGRWVEWSGEATSVNIYTTQESEIRIKPASEAFSAEAFFDPLHNDQLKDIAIGDQVRINGRLWGYYFLPNTIRLADGVVVKVEKKKTTDTKSQPQ